MARWLYHRGDRNGEVVVSGDRNGEVVVSGDLNDSNFVLGNAQARGYPIVYCSDGFCELTSFSRAQVMSKSCGCHFLYGEDTETEERSKIQEAVDHQKELKTNVTFYKKTGQYSRSLDGDAAIASKRLAAAEHRVASWSSPDSGCGSILFRCLLDIVPIKNEKGDVVLFLVSHKDVSNQQTGHDGTKWNGSDVNGDVGKAGDQSQPTTPTDSSDDDCAPSAEYMSQRRRSRAVLYHLSGTYNKQKGKKSKLQLRKIKHLSGNNTLPEYKVQEMKRSKFILLHYGIFKIGWDWLILLCTFYIAIIVPYNAAFYLVDGPNRRASIVTDVIVEMLFIIDIILNFRTTYVSKSGQVVYEPKLIAINYIRGLFLLDLLAALPFDVLYASQVNTGTLIHLLKVARLLRLARLMQKLDHYSQYSFVILTLLMAMFTVLAHWLACIWYVIGREELDRNPANWTVGE
ncbi:Potassium voltage-gated channel subfamily H member 8 [Lamellibrachia satsuma]|nr:Potassium voltage-gated channel subfamily H member 8 [Lamellibrachia satsuma]